MEVEREGGGREGGGREEKGREGEYIVCHMLWNLHTDGWHTQHLLLPTLSPPHSPMGL